MKSDLYLKFIGLGLSVVIIFGCSSSPDDTYTYSQSSAALEIPPNMSQPVTNPEFQIPGISSQQTTYSSYSTAEQQSKKVLPKLGKEISFVRDGNLFWLEMSMRPKQLWPILRSFIGKTGFEIKYSNQLTGTIDTSWRENEDGASLMTSLTSGDQGTYMDKFRLRLERGKGNKTLLFIRHKGARIAKDVVNKDAWMVEDEDVDPVIITETGEEKTLWISRPSDHELEIEMLQNFMVYLGLDEDAVDNELSSYSNKKLASIVSKGKGVALEVGENFPRTWRRIGLALDRMGFVVEDRNRSAGVYYISLPEQYETTEEQTWFEKLFNKDRKDIPHDYLLSISTKGNTTHVMIKARSKVQITNKIAEKILRQLQAHIS